MKEDYKDQEYYDWMKLIFLGAAGFVGFCLSLGLGIAMAVRGW